MQLEDKKSSMDLPHQRENGDPRITLVVKLGRALHRYGIPTHRLEGAMNRILLQLGLDGQFFSMPTGVLVSFGLPEEHRTSLVRVEPGEVDLEKQVLLDELVTELIAGKLSPVEGVRRIDEIVLSPPRYGPLFTVIAFGVASCAASRFFGGGWREAIASAAIGLLIGALSLVSQRSEDASRVFETGASIIAAVMAIVAALVFSPLSIYVTTLAGLIVLVPGLTLTTAVRELATRNLVSGTARMMGAALIFFEMGFGVALGSRVAKLILPTALNLAPLGLPDWTLLVSLILAPLGFVVLLRARLRDIPVVLAASLISFGGARFGGVLLGPQLGVCVGAIIIGAISNAYARVFNRPSAVPLVPGILLLVPGSIGFGSLAKFLDRDVLSGIDTAFTMILVAVALVTGLLVSNLIVPPRRAL
jgi:uncharacterized membrane protein YjjP (DUF1212 family)